MKRGKKFLLDGVFRGPEGAAPPDWKSGASTGDRSGALALLASRAQARPLQRLKAKRKASSSKGEPELQGDWVRDAAKTDRCAGETPEVRGVEVDAQTRCVHYRSTVDIVAIKMRCCGVYYACKDCHIAGEAVRRLLRG